MTQIHGYQASKPDLQNTLLQIAYMKSISGNYDDALDLLRENNPAPYKTLRLDQKFIGFAAMIQLRRAIHRYVVTHYEQASRTG